MKHLWIALCALILVFSVTMANAYYINKSTAQLIELLEQSERLAKAGDWEEALEKTQQAYDEWTSMGTYLHTVIRHSNIDDAEISFLQVLVFIECRSMEEYLAGSAALISQLSLIDETEHLSIKNLL